MSALATRWTRRSVPCASPELTRSSSVRRRRTPGKACRDSKGRSCSSRRAHSAFIPGPAPFAVHASAAFARSRQRSWRAATAEKKWSRPLLGSDVVVIGAFSLRGTALVGMSFTWVFMSLLSLPGTPAMGNAGRSEDELEGELHAVRVAVLVVVGFARAVEVLDPDPCAFGELPDEVRPAVGDPLGRRRRRPARKVGVAPGVAGR